jgi:hypothetical protein
VSTKLVREWKCDRCGAIKRVRDAKRRVLQPRRWAEVAINEFVEDVEDDRLHLCPKCHKRLYRWLHR